MPDTRPPAPPARQEVGPLLRELGGLRIAVLHPHDAEGRTLMSHLQRIGSHATEVWPIPARLDAEFDIVIMAIELDQRQRMAAFVQSRGELSPPLIAIVGYENPSMLQLVLESGAVAVLERPLKPFGLLTQMLMARTLWRQRTATLAQMRKLEGRFATVSKLTMAKTILIAREGLTEQEAHRRIQKLAMAGRTTVEDVAQTIIAASENAP
ncbi:MAG: Aliphatic amidase regulator [Paracidovorax wautersii]|uniref:Aliphatic amidase regulator n=1 Tax=Paracidovorax wautersii TaxID=1177982 RepID=A0A7V8JQ96_9BURK|nr:MAG: Aliphatic amidase regulator [Paracidovorax wautersii]